MQMMSGFTVEQQQKIVEALNTKLRNCSACGMQKTYQLVTEGLINLSVTSPIWYPSNAMYYQAPIYPNRGLPCVAVMCTNCGHLQLHSVFQLGLGAVLGLVPSAPLMSTEGR